MTDLLPAAWRKIPTENVQRTRASNLLQTDLEERIEQEKEKEQIHNHNQGS